MERGTVEENDVLQVCIDLSCIVFSMIPFQDSTREGRYSLAIEERLCRCHFLLFQRCFTGSPLFLTADAASLLDASVRAGFGNDVASGYPMSILADLDPKGCFSRLGFCNARQGLKYLEVIRIAAGPTYALSIG